MTALADLDTPPIYGVHVPALTPAGRGTPDIAPRPAGPTTSTGETR